MFRRSRGNNTAANSNPEPVSPHKQGITTGTPAPAAQEAPAVISRPENITQPVVAAQVSV